MPFKLENMFWLLPIALLSYCLFDQKLAVFFMSLSHFKMSSKILCLFFQPFIQLFVFTICCAINSSFDLFKRLALDSILVITSITVLKVLIARARPHMLCLGPTSFKFLSLDFNYHSTPSSHACMALAFCYTVSSYYPKLFLPLFLVSILVSFSRMHLGMHFLSDCLLGAFLGILVSQASAKILPLFLGIKKG